VRSKQYRSATSSSLSITTPFQSDVHLTQQHFGSLFVTAAPSAFTQGTGTAMQRQANQPYPLRTTPANLTFG
jgi:hypothetical protein